jgi:hypothetical protein
MADDILPFSSAFPEATEADWLREVEKALKGKGAETLTRKTADGIDRPPPAMFPAGIPTGDKSAMGLARVGSGAGSVGAVGFGGNLFLAGGFERI